jgi:hypothetical protein
MPSFVPHLQSFHYILSIAAKKTVSTQQKKRIPRPPFQASLYSPLGKNGRAEQGKSSMKSLQPPLFEALITLNESITKTRAATEEANTFLEQRSLCI